MLTFLICLCLGHVWQLSKRPLADLFPPSYVKFFEIKQLFLQKFALSGEKISHH